MIQNNKQILTSEQELDLLNQAGERLDKLLIQAAQRNLVNEIYRALIFLGNSINEKRRQAQIESQVKEAVNGEIPEKPALTEAAPQNGC